MRKVKQIFSAFGGAMLGLLLTAILAQLAFVVLTSIFPFPNLEAKGGIAVAIAFTAIPLVLGFVLAVWGAIKGWKWASPDSQSDRDQSSKNKN